MTAPQLATLKTATITQLNEAMLAIDGNAAGATVTINGRVVNKRLHDALQTQIHQLNTEKSMASQRTGMNPAVRKMLGIKDPLKQKNMKRGPHLRGPLCIAFMLKYKYGSV